MSNSINDSIDSTITVKFKAPSAADEKELDFVYALAEYPSRPDFMVKMRTISEQLTAFVNNILNVARVDNDQLTVELAEAKWEDLLRSAISAI